MKKLFSLFVAMMAAFSLSAATVYDWSGNVGVTILGHGGKTTVSTVKIHGNQDEVSAVKFEKSYVLADGHYMAIKPAEGAFKAGDVISFSGAINNSGARDAKYAMVQFYAADGATRLFQGDTVVNGQTMEDDLIVESFTLEADQDSILLGRYGTTNMFITMLSVAREAAPTHTYTVAGSSTDLFGTAWAPANEANDMSLVEGLYTWEKTDLELAAGSIEFKVCEDHAWTNCWPAQNYNLAIPEAGIYTITITFNAESKEVNALAQKTGEADVTPTVAMHGNFTGSWVDTENFTLAEGKATASLKLTMEVGNYEFGMRIGGAGNWTANGAQFTRENPSAEVVAGSGNLKLAADAAGEYTFTWTYETNTLAITFPGGDIPDPELPTVAIAGAFNNWDATVNVMTAAEDKLTASIKITLAAEDNEFKVVVGGSHWYAKDAMYDITRENAVVENVDQEIAMGPNLRLKADVAGEYTFIWTYEGNKLEVIFPEGDIPEPEVPTVAIAGAFNEWSATANVMTAAEDKLTASVTIALTADDVEFKVVVDGSHWLAKDALYNITRENPTVEAVDQEIPMGPNLNLKADVAGDYTFTWTYATKTLTITFPAKEEGIEETIAAGKAAKVLRDGHILILKGEKTFDVTGAIVR